MIAYLGYFLCDGWLQRDMVTAYYSNHLWHYSM